MGDLLTATAWQTARQLVGAALGSGMRYDTSTADPKYVGIRSRVARVELLVGADRIGTAVVKERWGEAGYDPKDLTAGSLATRVAYEAASLSFLDRLGCRKLAPRLIGVDYDQGVLVMEDLGEGPGLLEHLLGDNPRQADQALRAYATAMGELHSASAGQAGTFGEVLPQFGARPVNPTVAANDQLEVFVGAVEALGVRVPQDVRALLMATAERMRNPGPFLALTHGDACPGHDRTSPFPHAASSAASPPSLSMRP